MAARQRGWLGRPENVRLVDELRQKLVADDCDLLIFLGAGLSYGVDRGRAMFERYEYDDGQRFPSWAGLIKRMHKRLHNLPDLEPHKDALKAFFAEQGPLDCAELFREKIGVPNYAAFLKEQFATKAGDKDRLTWSHKELVRLSPKRIFTTNYDELIELAFRTEAQPIRISVSPSEFLAHRVEKPERHLIKLHGSIDRPDTLVLTRTDYARSRKERSEMFTYLGQQLQNTSFLFIGFSLTDPNFGLLQDEARLAMGSAMPVSYVVQGSPDAIKEAYLRSMGVNTISLDCWEDLPSFFRAINP